YLDPQLRGDSIGWLGQCPNLLVCRTFSKAYGLAGLRAGFGLAHPAVADLMNRARQPFHVSSVGPAAAIAALAGHDFVDRSRMLNSRGMEMLTAGFRRLGLSWIPSRANFVAVRVGKGAEVFQKLLRQGVIVRPVGGYGLPEYLRVSIGTEAENV